MKNIKKVSIALVSIFTFMMTAAAQKETTEAVPNRYDLIQKEVESIVNGDVLGQAVVGVCARTGDGQTIINITADDMLVPASNMKLISTGAALHALGGDYRYRTSLAYDGNIVEGVLIGDIYILGGGDPTTASKDSIADSLEHTFSMWEKLIKDAGINEIDGRIIGASGNFFTGMTEEPSWMWNDIGTYYGAGTTGLMFYENVQSFEVSAGASPGEALNISPIYPEVPWMEFRYACSTGKAGTGDQLYMYTSDLAPVAEIRGTFAVDRKPKRVDCSNKYPELTCAHHFTRWIEEHGITCRYKAADTRLHRITLPDSLISLGQTSSPTLRRIAFVTNHASNNLYAETLMRTLGKELKSEGSYDSSYVAIKNILQDLKVDITKGLKIQDGSGLSRQNLVSPAFFCRFLEAMMSSPCFEDFAESLPSPGSAGTLAANMRSYPAEMKERIKVKSGSMSGVRCYSGYIIPREGSKDETIIFSIMVNNCTEPTWKVRPLLDKIMGLLAGLE